MTPEIALHLSLDGIAVLSRAPEGGWWREGVVRLDAEDMAEGLTRLRDRAAARVGEGFTSVLILPDSQLLYTSLERDDRKPDETIRAFLKGRTPYAVEDLAYDWEQRGDRLQVAVVALETLLEAETFAADFGFRPVAVVADPEDSIYPGLPNFGRTGIATELLGGATLDLNLGDGFDVTPAPAPPAMPEPEPEPEMAAPEPDDAPPAEPEPEPEVTASDPAETAPAEPEPEPVAAAPTIPAPAPAPEPEPVEAALPEAAAETPAPDDAREAATPEAPQPKEEPIFARSRKAIAEADAEHQPTFSTRRKPDAQPEPLEEVRIAPRLTTPPRPGTPPPPRSGTAAPTVRIEPRADGIAASTPAAAPADRPSKVAPVVAAAGGLAATIGALRARRSERRIATEEEKARAAEAEALALPGLAREKASQPERSGLGLGLYLTLGLLALLAVVGLGAAFLDGGDPVEQAVVAPEPALPVPDAPAAPDSGPVILTDTVPILPVEEAPAPDAPAAPDAPETDLAALLPAPDGTSTASPIPDLVDPPLPVPGATPEELAEADAPEADPGPLEVFSARGAFEAAPTPAAPEPQDAAEIYLASIDPVVAAEDAVALPAARTPEDGFTPQTLPAPPGVVFDTDTETGLIAPSPEGVLAPGGFALVSGRPDVMPTPRPGDAPVASEPDAGAAAELDDEARAILRRTRPVERPTDAAEQVERQSFGGLTREEITRTRPQPRPTSIQDAAVRRAQESETADRIAAEQDAATQTAAEQAAIEAAAASLASRGAQTAPTGPVSELALVQSDRPRTRPRSVERDAARIVTQRRQQASAAPAAAAATPQARQADQGSPQIRSAGGNVARAATERNQLRLNRINLIGVYGRPSARRALVRLSNGRYVKVEVGDRLDRGRVVAIGEDQLVYQKGGRNVGLNLPNG
ncbi:hypothetical protein [uncultured Jannaschia sp.]|uniref:hypothetical protein n=1 Tax=uncultured Jannaschia sp. TaxID=293347 RepID=UPI002620B86B|nr:hypothetical protein [uncultured Jannaschia sp.]